MACAGSENAGPSPPFPTQPQRLADPAGTGLALPARLCVGELELLCVPVVPHQRLQNVAEVLQAAQLCDLDHLATAIGQALLERDELNACGDHGSDLRQSQPEVGHQAQRLEPAERVLHARAVDQGQAAIVAAAKVAQRRCRERAAEITDDTAASVREEALVLLNTEFIWN